MGEYTRGQRVFETTVIAVFCALAAYCLIRMSGSILTVACAALVAWLATDFFSGLVHWAFDTWGSVRTRFVGAWFIRSFREHHLDPRAMARHDFVETNGSSAVAALPLLVLGIVMDPGFGQALVTFLALGALVANQCHKWAHLRREERGSLVRLLQRSGLTLSPEVHRRHHARPHDSHYCTASGWMNAPLEAVGFFRGLEAGIAGLTRVRPRRDEAA
jgi:ubiquitin-conjugating enzyme E2 variant